MPAWLLRSSGFLLSLPAYLLLSRSLMATPPSAFLDATPFVLHLAHDTSDFELVQTHWTKNFLRKFSLEQPVHVLMARVLRQIREDSYSIREYYTFPLEEVTTNKKTRIMQIRRAITQLSNVQLTFEMPQAGRVYFLSLVNGVEERRTGHNGTSVTILFNPQLYHYLLNIAWLDSCLLDSTAS